MRGGTTKILAILLAAVISTLASPLQAQSSGETIEVSPFVGYLFGGTVYDFNNSPPGTSHSEWKVTLGDHASYGLRLGYTFRNGLEPEIELSRAETKLLFQVPSRPSDLPVTMDFYLAGLTYNLASNRVRPYVTLAAGAARLAGAGDAQSRFTGKLALGLKAFVTSWLALRMEAGGYATRLAEAPFGIPCTTFPLGQQNLTPVGCASRSWLYNGELGGGLVFAF